MCKKQKHKLFIFTHLQLELYQGQLCFSLTDNSYINEVSPQHYQSRLRPIETSLLLNYSEIPLAYCWGPERVCYPVEEVKELLQERTLRLSLMGVVEEVKWADRKVVNPKEGEV